MKQLVKLFILFFSLSVFVFPNFATAATTSQYVTQAQEVMEHIQKSLYDSRTGLYNKSTTEAKPDYIWREAAMFSALVGAARHDRATYGPLMRKHFAAMEVYWDTKSPIPAYEPSPTRGNGNDKYYDDNAWLIITFAEAFQLTHEQAYLRRATQVADFVASGWDDQLGGGIWWHASHKDNSKNTCANGPAAVGYLCLARAGSKSEAVRWTQAAIKTVEWTTSKLQDRDGLFDDRVIVATGEVKRGKLTYNAALMLRANLDLYHQTADLKYVNEAKRIGKAAAWFQSKDGIYRDPLKWSHFMVEADIALYRTTGEAYLLERAKTNVDGYYNAWKKEKPADMMSNAATARMLWLMADVETEVGKAFWKDAEKMIAK